MVAVPVEHATPLNSSRPLKILYHHRTQSRDGQYVHIAELIGALRAIGHEVIVVEPPHAASAKFGDDPRAQRLAKKFIPGHLYEIMELAYSIPEFIRMARACRLHRPDLLYERANIYMLSGLLIARRYRLRYLLEVNGSLVQERISQLHFPRVAAWTERAIWQAADMVLPVTQVLARMIEAQGVPRARIKVIPNGVELERFEPGDDSDMRRRLSLDGKLVLGFTGFVREWHRADKIIDFLAGGSLPANTHFLIVGDGPAKAELHEQARRLGVADRLTITGVVPREEVSRYVRCFDIALQPGVVHYASPLKLLEYMAVARAIVAPDTENIRELLVHEENALLVEPENPVALGAALQRLAGDKNLRARLGAAARRSILTRGLTWQHNAHIVAALADPSPAPAP